MLAFDSPNLMGSHISPNGGVYRERKRNGRNLTQGPLSELDSHECRLGERVSHSLYDYNQRRGLAIPNELVNIDKIRWANHSFDSFKQPGPDRIFSALLQKGSEYVASIQCWLFYQAPKACKIAQVVFKTGYIKYKGKAYRLDQFDLLHSEDTRETRRETCTQGYDPLHIGQQTYQSIKGYEGSLNSLI